MATTTKTRKPKPGEAGFDSSSSLSDFDIDGDSESTSTSTSTKSQVTPEVSTDSTTDNIVDRISSLQIGAERAATVVCEKMHSENRTLPDEREKAVFRASGWTDTNRAGTRQIWEIELGREKLRARIRERLGTKIERQSEVDSLAKADANLAEQGPAIEIEIQKLQSQLDNLRRVASDAAAIVARRNEAIAASADERLLPPWLAGERARQRAEIKQAAARSDWWGWQSDVDGYPDLLTRDPMSNSDCVAIMHILRCRLPDAILDGSRQLFDHAAIAKWFDSLRSELARKTPAVDAGRAELKAALAALDDQQRGWFLRDHDSRLAAKSESSTS
jgi:hypothetical protein